VKARDQVIDAEDLCDGRSSAYTDSHHLTIARHYIELIKPQPGERVLDLACNAGFGGLPARVAIGQADRVVGTNTSSGMLLKAGAKKAKRDPDNLQFVRHFIDDLSLLDAVRDSKFDNTRRLTDSGYYAFTELDT